MKSFRQNIQIKSMAFRAYERDTKFMEHTTGIVLTKMGREVIDAITLDRTTIHSSLYKEGRG